MALSPASIDYTDRDFDSLTARLEGLLRSVFPDWTDFQVATFGNILREMFAFVGDNLAFYQDKQAKESRIVSAVSRKNLIALSKLIAFEASTATAATVDETFTLEEVPVNDVIIPGGSVVRTADVGGAIEFQLLADLTFSAGSNPPTITQAVENSDTLSEIFTSNGLQNQEFELEETPYLDDSSIIVAGDGAYTEVQNFLNSTSSDKHYTAAVDQNDRATIRFGNGVNGSIPQGSLTVIYKTGGGSAGNVEVNTISTIDGNFTDIFGNPVSVSVTNAAKASGGTDRQTIAQIKELAPESLRVLNRTVSREDYEINARKVTQVSRALMTTSNEDGTIDENAGILYIIPAGGGLPSQALKDTVLIQVTETFPNTLTFSLVVQDPVYLTVNVEATVFLQQGFTETDVRTAVDDALATHFAVENDDGSSNTNVDFGFNQKDNAGNPAGEIAKSDIANVIRDTVGVRKMGDNLEDFKLNSDTTDLAILLREFPQLGTVLLRNGDTGLLF